MQHFLMAMIYKVWAKCGHGGLEGADVRGLQRFYQRKQCDSFCAPGRISNLLPRSGRPRLLAGAIFTRDHVHP